ncbi:MAG: BatD family protein [Granulosicoccus sp.]
MSFDTNDRRIAIVRLTFTLLIVMLSAQLMMQTAALAQDVSVRAELSASTITRDESVVLTITATGIDAELDVSSLATDFNVVGRSSSRQMGTVIGANNQAVTTSVVSWALELLPKGEGIFTVPAVKVGDYETQLLSLTVNAVPQGAKRDIFLEASVDSDSPWVQSQVVMTLRVYQAIEIIDGGLDIPEADDLVVERIGEDTRSREVRDGREYSVTERRFALFPQKSGPITIDPVTLSVTVPAEPDRVRGFFSPTRKLSRSSDSITLDVQARPPSGTGWWLPARKVSLQARWQGDPQSAQVDQPLTRTIVMRAEGVLESQLPQISIPAIDGLSLYAEDPQLAMGIADSGLVSEQQINWALIPQRSGTLTLPAISVEWFNTLTGQVESSELPAETIEVSAAPAGNPASAGSGNPQDLALTDSRDALSVAGIGSDSTSSQALSPAASTDDNLPATTALDDRLIALESSLQNWRWITYCVVGLWLLTIAAGLWLRKRVFAAPVERLEGSDDHRSSSMGARIDDLYRQVAPMSEIDKACVEGDILEVKRSLLVWAARQWPADTPTTLDALQARLPEGAARDKLARVQLALYSKHGYSSIMPSLATELASFVDDLRAALQQAGTKLDEGGIAGNMANNVSLSTKGGSRLPQL